jgi:protein TonB
MTHANFSKRERAAIAIATLTFIGISTLAHFAIGGYIGSHLPHWATPAADQSPKPLHWTTFAHPSPTPTPAPTPTPRPTPTPIQHVTRATPRASTPARIHVHDDLPKHDASTPKPGQPVPIDVPADMTVTPDARSSEIPFSTPPPDDTSPKPATPATFKRKIIPEYSSVCIDEGAGGDVTIDVTIDPDGSLAAAWVGQTSGFPCLDAAALSAAKESTYNPPEVGGRPIAETYLILYEFSIDS